MFPAPAYVWLQCCAIYKDGRCDGMSAQNSSYCQAHGEELNKCRQHYKGLEEDFEILLKAERTYPMRQWLTNAGTICHDIANARRDVQMRFFSYLGADNITHSQRIWKLLDEGNLFEARLRSLPEEKPSPRLESRDNQPGFVQQRCLCTGLMLSVQEEPCSANDTGGKPSLSSQVGPEHEQCTSDVLPGVQCAPPESASADSLNINKTFYPSENLRKPVLAGNHDPQHCSSLPTSVPTQFPDHGAYCQTLFGCTLLGSLVKVNALSEFIDPYGTIARLPLEQVWSAPSVCLRELSSFAGQLAYACAVGESLAWAANQQLSP